jgi:hypothetical protein
VIANGTRVYQLPYNGEWVVDIVDDRNNSQVITTFPPGAAGLPYLHAFLRGYFNLTRDVRS